MHCCEGSFFSISVSALYVEASAGIRNNCSCRGCSVAPENGSCIIRNNASRVSVSKMSDNSIISYCSAFDSGNGICSSCKCRVSYVCGDIGSGDSSAAGIINDYIHCCECAFFGIGVAALNIEAPASIRNNCSGRACSIAPKNCGCIIRNNTSRVSISKMSNNSIIVYSSAFNGGNRIGCGCKSCICYGCVDIGSGDCSPSGIIDNNIHC